MFHFSSKHPLLIGVVHLLPTPGSAEAADMAVLLERARGDALALADGGADAVVVENFGDSPFFKEDVPAETIAAMALAVQAVSDAAPGLAIGVNVLRNDARAALGLCASTAARFLRVNVHTGAAITDQGWIEGRAAQTLRTRARLCPEALVLADVHVKHATPAGNATLAQAARETIGRGRADGLIVTGSATGDPPRVEDLTEVREAVGDALLLVGSGLDEGRAAELMGPADGAIVGTSLKEGGQVDRPVDPERVRRLRAALG